MSMIYPSQEVINKMKEVTKNKEQMEWVYGQLNINNLNNISNNEKSAIAQILCQIFESELFKKGIKFTNYSGTGICGIRTKEDKEVPNNLLEKLEKLGFIIENDGYGITFPDEPTEFEIIELCEIDYDGRIMIITCTKIPEIYIYFELWPTWDFPEECRMKEDFGTDLLKLYNEIFN